MKKTIISFLIFALSITLAFLLTACTVQPTPEPECNHAYVKETVAPTCTENGHDTFSCTKCDHYYTIQINAGHVPSAPVEENRVEPTCAVKGHYDSVIYCGSCNAELSRSNVSINTDPNAHGTIDDNNICSDCGELMLISSEGLEYALNSDGKSYTVAGIGSFTGKDVFIGLYNGLPVTTIGDFAFERCSGLTTVTIGNGVTKIGDFAFSDCSGLTSITIPDSVTTIGYSAFERCSGLTSITIPDSITTIGGGAFSGCSGLTSITIPDSVTTIGYSAFRFCSNLTNITIPDSVTTIGYGAFYGCSNLTSVTMGDSIAIIGDYAFYGCSGLTSVTMGDSIAIIGDFAFSGCSNLTSVTMGGSITIIGDYAFYGCSGLASVTMGDSITIIGDYAFCSCSGLTSIKYRGTEEQWNAITTGEYWDSYTGEYTITYNYTEE